MILSDFYKEFPTKESCVSQHLSNDLICKCCKGKDFSFLDSSDKCNSIYHLSLSFVILDYLINMVQFF